MGNDQGPSGRSEKFCSGCGTGLADGVSFCPSCGTRSAASPLAADSNGPPSRAAAVVVLTILLGVGAAAMYFSSTTKPVQRAVTGSPSAAPGAETPGGVPPGHPNIALPQEVVELIDRLSEEAEAAPDNVEIWQRLARARYRAALLNPSYYEPAKQALEHLLELDPDNLDGIRTQGNVAYDRGDYASAAKHFRRYLELNSDDPGVRTDLGSTLLFLGNREEAKEIYRAVIKSSPQFPQAYVNLGIALHSEGNTEEAAGLFKHAREVAKDPEQRKRIDQIVAAAAGAKPEGHPGAAPSAAATSPTPRPQATTAASNAQSEFQKGVDQLFTGHRIVGPRVVKIDWTGDLTASILLDNFPMDKMPPVMRNKFKSTINGEISGLATKYSVSLTGLGVSLVDAASNRVMDTFDGKELIGVFDVPADGYP